MIDAGKRHILGVGLNVVDYDGAVERVMQAAEAGRPLAVSALAVHGLMTGALDATHRFRLNAFDLLCPDGQPVRWALKWLHGARLPERVYGPNLMLRVCQEAARRGTPIFLFGGSQEMLDDLCRSLLEHAPGLVIAGVKPSRFRKITDAERADLIREVRESGARIAFVGLGCPRQEVFAYEMREELGMPLLAVGAAFAFHSGRLSQAPRWLQDRGLEWAYRLACEPKRLWKRYLMLNPLFLSMLALQATRVYTPGPEGKAPEGRVCYG